MVTLFSIVIIVFYSGETLIICFVCMFINSLKLIHQLTESGYTFDCTHHKKVIRYNEKVL